MVTNCPVDGIRDDGSKVTASSALGQFVAKRLIVSIPTVLYKTITFSPPLRPAKLKLSQGTKHGYITKVFLSYRKPWWRAAGFCGLTQSLNGLISVTRDTSNDRVGHFSLLGFVAGDPGRKWSKLPPGDRRQAVVDHMKSVFGQLVEDLPEPIGYIEQIWWDERYSAGCPSPAMPPGLLTEVGKELRTSYRKFYFVGTEMAFEWRGYMEGAVRSGERGAKEVLMSLKKSKM